MEIGKEADFKEGEGKKVFASGKELAVFKADGKIYAISNTCCHRGGPLAEGSLEGDIVSCPWHGWQYDIKTGKCKNIPGAKVPGYKVKVEAGKVFVDLG
jgi:NAD(P)H-dependent nitrite reductase small subunit